MMHYVEYLPLGTILTEADKDGGSAGLVRQWNLSNKQKKLEGAKAG
jgi:hypothetical protein